MKHNYGKETCFHMLSSVDEPDNPSVSTARLILPLDIELFPHQHDTST